MSRIVEQFWVLDFDRCLVDVESLYTYFLSLAEEIAGISPHTIDLKRIEAEQVGESFDQYSYVAQYASALDMERIAEQFIAGTKESLFWNNGALELIEHIGSSTDRLAAIITFGGEKWQTLKVRAAIKGLLPFEIVSGVNKMQYIATWKRDDGLFAIPNVLYPNVLAHEVILVDDKAKAFGGMDMIQGVRGYWYQSGKLLVSQTGKIPHSVRVVRGSLADIINHE